MAAGAGERGVAVVTDRRAPLHVLEQRAADGLKRLRLPADIITVFQLPASDAAGERDVDDWTAMASAVRERRTGLLLLDLDLSARVDAVSRFAQAVATVEPWFIVQGHVLSHDNAASAQLLALLVLMDEHRREQRAIRRALRLRRRRRDAT